MEKIKIRWNADSRKFNNTKAICNNNQLVLFDILQIKHIIDFQNKTQIFPAIYLYCRENLPVERKYQRFRAAALRNKCEQKKSVYLYELTIAYFV